MEAPALVAAEPSALAGPAEEAETAASAGLVGEWAAGAPELGEASAPVADLLDEQTRSLVE
ncbi:MAG: phage repressor protein, partial [Chloroflexi bacterium]|nr:phage repressor protein [Chloroflexota bacterium]